MDDFAIEKTFFDGVPEVDGVEITVILFENIPQMIR
jgi:hypothetical protein